MFRLLPAGLIAAGALPFGCASDQAERGDVEVRSPPDVPAKPHFDAAVYGDGAPSLDPGRLSLTQRVRAWTFDETTGVFALGGPVEGVRVCLRDYDFSIVPCVHTDADGVFTIRGAPKQADVLLETDKDGFIPAVEPWITGDRDVDMTNEQLALWLLPETAVDALGPDGEPWVRSKGIILFGAWQADFRYFQPGVTVSTVPETSVIYYDGALTLAPDATSTVLGLDPDAVAGSPADRSGALWNVEERTYDVTFDHPDVTCVISGTWSDEFAILGYATPDRTVMRAPAVAGHITQAVGAWCPPY